MVLHIPNNFLRVVLCHFKIMIYSFQCFLKNLLLWICSLSAFSNSINKCQDNNKQFLCLQVPDQTIVQCVRVYAYNVTAEGAFPSLNTCRMSTKENTDASPPKSGKPSLTCLLDCTLFNFSYVPLLMISRTVSYTHLDVYKRQLLRSMWKRQF